jgi:hypothetical protein
MLACVAECVSVGTGYGADDAGVGASHQVRGGAVTVSRASAGHQASVPRGARGRDQGVTSTLRAVRSSIALYPAGTPSRSVVVSKTLPGSMVPFRMSGMSSSM